MNKTSNYDKTNPESIETYALRLKDKTFLDVINEQGNATQKNIDAYSNRLRKGGLGNLLEEVYFGYKANSKQEADFSEAGVELKVSPYEIKKNGELRAGERLVLTMISYDGPVESDFYKSHAWTKMKRILLIYYLRDRALKDNLLYKISYVKLFTPSDADLEIIKQDYLYITNKIKAGKAHEISEGDTMYLGACTKGATAKKSTVKQYYGEHIPARKRAFCFKNSYMTYVLNHYLAGVESENSVLKKSNKIKTKSFEEILYEIVEKYIGKTDKELCELFGREYNNNKAQWNELACKMLGIRDANADEFSKANIKVKTIRIEQNNTIRESMSLPPFKFGEFVKEDFEDSTLRNYFDETKFLFFVWKKDKEQDEYKVVGCQLWNMSVNDLDNIVKTEWEEYKHIVKYGVEFIKKVDSKGKIKFENNLPKKTDTKIIHMRPHATKAAYRFKNGEEYGNVERDANILPNGEFMTTQSFWLNNDYVLSQLECLNKVVDRNEED